MGHAAGLGNRATVSLVQAGMKTTTRLALTLLAVLAVAATGCAGLRGGGPGSGSGPIEHPTGPDDLVLRIDRCCGFVPLEYAVSRIPSFSLYGDGRLVTQGPQIEIYPGPALPNLLVRRLDEAAVQAILAEARRAGLLGPDRAYDHMTEADADTTIFTVVAGGRVHTVSVYALGDAPDPAMPDEEREAREALDAFVNRVGDPTWLPDGSVGEEEAFAFDELRVFVREGPPQQDDPALEQPVVDWPLERSLLSFGDPLENDPAFRCGSVDAAALDAVRPKAELANELTPWRSGGDLYSLVLRPLLPDESGCEGLEA